MRNELGPDRLWLVVMLLGLVLYAVLGTALAVFAVAK